MISRSIWTITLITLTTAGLAAAQSVDSSPPNDSAATADSAPAAAPTEAPTSEYRLNDRLSPAYDQTMRVNDAMDWLSQVTQINVTADWNHLEGVGIYPETRIRLVNGLTLRQAIELIIRQIETEEAPLVWESSPHFVTILTKDRANRRPETRMYNITDMLHEVRNFSHLARKFDLAELASQDVGSGSSGGGVDFFDDLDDGLAEDNSPNGRAQRIINLIESTVEPDIWGVDGSIRFYNGRLVVRAPQYVHRQIGIPEFVMPRDGFQPAGAGSRDLLGDEAFGQRTVVGGLRGGTGLYDPQVSVLREGTQIVGQAAVGPDPRYVHWGGTATQVNVQAIENFSVQEGSRDFSSQRYVNPRRRSNGVGGIVPGSP